MSFPPLDSNPNAVYKETNPLEARETPEQNPLPFRAVVPPPFAQSHSKKRKREPQDEDSGPSRRIVRLTPVETDTLAQEAYFYTDPSKNRWKVDPFFQPNVVRRYSKLSRLDVLIKAFWYLQETHHPLEDVPKNAFISNFYDRAKSFFSCNCPKGEPQRIQLIKLANRISKLRYSKTLNAVFHGEFREEYTSFLKKVESAGYKTSYETPPQSVELPEKYNLSFLCIRKKSLKR